MDTSVATDDLLATHRYQVHSFASRVLPVPAERSVSVYLPPQYQEQPDRHFPVFFLHDGQNLFDGRTSYVPGSTWRAHATADELNAAGEIEPVILVGVANSGFRRMAEYTPTRDPRMAGGDGPLYGELLADELKPWIAGRYRTLSGPADTGVGGSSLGGLISLYLGLERPEIFGKLAVMSPSIWWHQRSVLRFVQRARPAPRPRIWLDMGTAEGQRHLLDADHLYSALLQQGWRSGIDLVYERVEGGTHNEEAWARRFGTVLRFLFPARPDRPN